MAACAMPSALWLHSMCEPAPLVNRWPLAAERLWWVDIQKVRQHQRKAFGWLGQAVPLSLGLLGARPFACAKG